MKHWSEIEELKKHRKTLNDQIPDLEKELEKLLEANNEVVVLLYSRRCLEVMVTDICKKETIKFSKTVALKGRVDKLRREKTIPDHIISSMFNLNNISTYGAHPKEFDPRQVQTVLINLVTIIEWYISYKGFETTNLITKPYDTHSIVVKETDFPHTDITAKSPYKSLNFWQKLKQRKLIHIMIVYTAAAFAIFEFTDIITGPLNFPDELLTIVMYCGAIGFIVTLVLSWFFKTTTDGVKLRKHLSSEQKDQFYPTDKLLKVKLGNHKEKMARMSSLVVIVSVLALFLFYSGKAITFTERDWVVITDFKNLTDETIFDHSLNTAFALSINQSRYVNVITRQRMQKTLKRMKKEDKLHIDEETGREIAIREGIKVCIIPGISRVGSRYILTAKIMEAETGDIFRSEILYVQNQGYYEKAVEEYKAALQIDPYMMLTYGGVIWVYLEKIGQMDSAFVWSKKMIKYGSDNPWGYFNLGSAYVGINDFENAELEYLKAGDLNLNFFLNQYRLAHLYRIQGENDKAIELLKNILKINPNEISAHYDLGVNYLAAGDFKLSRDHFLTFKKHAEQSKLKSPKDPGTLIALGAVLSRLGEKETGWKIGKKAIELDSTFHFRYAKFLATQDKKTEALVHLEKALENGYRNLVWIKLNPDIYLLHEEIRYKKLINQYFAEN